MLHHFYDPFPTVEDIMNEECADMQMWGCANENDTNDK